MENKFIISSFLGACRKPQFQKHWMTAETWCDVIAHHFKLSPEVKYNGKQLNNAISRNKVDASQIDSSSGLETSDATSGASVFRQSYRQKNSSAKVYCFYAAPKGEKPIGIDSTNKWFNNIYDGAELLYIRVNRGATFSLSSDVDIPRSANEGAIGGKRKRPQNSKQGGFSSGNDVPFASTSDASSSSAFVSPLYCPFSFFDSPEAIILFRPLEGETTLEGISNQIDVLEKVNASEHGYLDIIKKISNMNIDEVPTYQIYRLRQKSMYLSLALLFAKENMNKRNCQGASKTSRRQWYSYHYYYRQNYRRVGGEAKRDVASIMGAGMDRREESEALFHKRETRRVRFVG